MMDYAKLDGHAVIPCANYLEWAKWFETADRHVAKTFFTDGIWVSTVFLGLDHGFGGPPRWFETTIFGGERDEECQRYATWDEAAAGHEKIVQEVQALLDPS